MNIFEENKNVIIDPNIQKSLNEPPEDSTGFNEGHEEFLNMLIEKLKKGEIDIHNPQTLYNRPIYDKLPENEQEKADLTAINLMSMIRQIQSLWSMEQKASFQIQNLVESVFQMKSRFEDKYGDVYII